MKIRITKCSKPEKGNLETWYKDKIGEVFVVADSTKWYHWVVYNNLKGKPCRDTVNVDDCEVLEDES